jgi:hypothetical protein
MKILLTIIFCFTTHAYADYFSKKDFHLAIGAQGSSLVYKRGIITYEGYQIIPIYSLNLFREDLFIAGSALYSNVKFTENFRVLSRFNANATKDEPAYYTTEKENDRVRREKTNEIDLFFQYDFNHSTYLRLEYSKDISAHHGQYSAMHFRYDLRNTDAPTLIQPGLFVSAGFADKSHNEYLYGTGASSGFNNIEYGFSITSPKAIDNFWPTLKLTHFEILGDNKDASFVEEKSGLSIEFLFAKKVF